MTNKNPYNADFSREMDEDPNMGMSPRWRKKNPNGIKPKKFKVEFGSTKKKAK